MLCSAATVGAGPAPAPARHLACYRAKSGGATTTRTVSAEDQFGPLSLKVKNPKILCVPAEASVLP